MPRKKKGDQRGSSPEKPHLFLGMEQQRQAGRQQGNQYGNFNPDGLITNSANTNNHWAPLPPQSGHGQMTASEQHGETFKQLTEMFHGIVEDQVVAIILHECEGKVEEAIEKLMMLVPDTEGELEEQVGTSVSMRTIAQSLSSPSYEQHPGMMRQQMSQPIPTPPSRRSRLPSQSAAVMPGDMQQLHMLSPKTPSMAPEIQALFANVQGDGNTTHQSVQSAMQALDSYAGATPLSFQTSPSEANMFNVYYDMDMNQQTLAMQDNISQDYSHPQPLHNFQYQSSGMSLNQGPVMHATTSPSTSGIGAFNAVDISPRANFSVPPPNYVCSSGNDAYNVNSSGMALMDPQQYTGNNLSLSGQSNEQMSGQLPNSNHLQIFSESPSPSALSPTSPQEMVKQHQAQPPSQPKGGNQLGSIKHTSASMPPASMITARRGHRKQTLSLNPEEREALENLIEDVIIGGVGEGIIDGDESTSSDSDSDDNVLNVVAPMFAEEDASMAIMEAGQEGKENDGQNAPTTGTGTMSKTYPAQLKVAVKHMKNLPPRFLRRLQNAQKQIEAAAALEKELEKVRLEDEDVMGLIKEKERGGRTKEEQIKDTKRRIRDLLEDLDQYIDEGIVVIEPGEELRELPSIEEKSPTSIQPPDVQRAAPAKSPHEQPMQQLHGVISSPGTDGFPTRGNQSLNPMQNSDRMPDTKTPSPQPRPINPQANRSPFMLTVNAVNCQDLERELLSSGSQDGAANLKQSSSVPSDLSQTGGSATPDGARYVPQHYLQGVSRDLMGRDYNVDRKTRLSANAPEFVPMQQPPLVRSYTPPQRLQGTPPSTAEQSMLASQDARFVKTLSSYAHPADRMSPHMVASVANYGRASPHMMGVHGTAGVVPQQLPPTDIPPPPFVPKPAGSQPSGVERSASPAFIRAKLAPTTVASRGPVPTARAPNINMVPVQQYTVPPPPLQGYPGRAVPSTYAFPNPFLTQANYTAWAAMAASGDKHHPTAGLRGPPPPAYGHPLVGTPLKASPQLTRKNRAPTPTTHIYPSIRPGVIPAAAQYTGVRLQGVGAGYPFMPSMAPNICQTVSPDTAKVKVQQLLKDGQKVMVILRGCTGSGKTTIAKEIVSEQGVVLSTDAFFQRAEAYEFDYGKIGEAHEWNQKRAKEALESGKNPVIIDNTNTQAWEMKFYVTQALKHGYQVEIMEPDTAWRFNVKELAKRNVHGVPAERIQRMIERYEIYITLQGILGVGDKKQSEVERQQMYNQLQQQQEQDPAAKRSTRKRKKKKRKRNRKRDRGNKTTDAGVNDESLHKNSSDDSSDEENTVDSSRATPESPTLPEASAAAGGDSVDCISSLNGVETRTEHHQEESSTKDPLIDMNRDVGKSPDKEQPGVVVNSELAFGDGSIATPRMLSSNSDHESNPVSNAQRDSVSPETLIEDVSKSFSDSTESLKNIKILPVSDGEQDEEENVEDSVFVDSQRSQDNTKESCDRIMTQSNSKEATRVENELCEVQSKEAEVSRQITEDSTCHDDVECGKTRGHCEENAATEGIEVRASVEEGRLPGNISAACVGDIPYIDEDIKSKFIGRDTTDDNLHRSAAESNGAVDDSSDDDLDLEYEVKQIIQEGIMKRLVKKELAEFLQKCPQQLPGEDAQTAVVDKEAQKRVIMCEMQKAVESLYLGDEQDVDLDLDREFEGFAAEELQDLDSEIQDDDEEECGGSTRLAPITNGELAGDDMIVQGYPIDVQLGLCASSDERTPAHLLSTVEQSYWTPSVGTLDAYEIRASSGKSHVTRPPAEHPSRCAPAPAAGAQPTNSTEPHANSTAPMPPREATKREKKMNKNPSKQTSAAGFWLSPDVSSSEIPSEDAEGSTAESLQPDSLSSSPLRHAAEGKPSADSSGESQDHNAGKVINQELIDNTVEPSWLAEVPPAPPDGPGVDDEAATYLSGHVQEKLMAGSWAMPVLQTIPAAATDCRMSAPASTGVHQETYTDPGDFSLVDRLQSCDDPSVFPHFGQNFHSVLWSRPRPIVAVTPALSEGESTPGSQSSSPSRPLRVRLEKSCDTADLEDAQQTEGVAFLVNCFPSVTPSDLQDVLDQCDGNTSWAVNILLDSHHVSPGHGSHDVGPHRDINENAVNPDGVPLMQHVSPERTPPLQSAEDASPVTSPATLLCLCQGSLLSTNELIAGDIISEVTSSSMRRLQSINEFQNQLSHEEGMARTQQQQQQPQGNEMHREEDLAFSIPWEPPSHDGDDLVVNLGLADSFAEPAVKSPGGVRPASSFQRLASADSDVSADNSFSRDGGASPVTLTLTPDAARQLIQLFGPVGFHMEPESLCDADLLVRVPHRTARQLHRQWARTLQEKFCLEEAAIQQMMERDAALARQLQTEEMHVAPPRVSCSPARSVPIQPPLRESQSEPLLPSLLPRSSPPPSLREIMQEETALEVSRQEYQESQTDANTKGVLSTRLKSQQLKEMFPGIDQQVLDSIFQANGYCLDATVKTVQASVGDYKGPQTVMTPEAQRKYEDTLLKKAIDESLREQWLGIGEDAVDSADDEGDGYQTLDDPAYQDYRAEASLHYKLRQECFQKAQDAYRRDMKPVASFYSQQGHLHTEKLRQANRLAAQKIVEHRAKRQARQAEGSPERGDGAGRPQPRGRGQDQTSRHGLPEETQIQLLGSEPQHAPGPAQVPGAVTSSRNTE